MLIALLLTLALGATPTPQGVEVTWAGDQALILRSTSRLTPEQARSGQYPVARLPGRNGRLLDTTAPDGATLYYTLGSETTAVTTPPKQLPRLRAPRLLIDKRRFVLEVQDGGQVVKRYPVALGRNPVNRKICFDRASTPEGRFRIIGVQPNATYFKAYDLDYPTEADRERYRFAAAHGLLPPGNPDIGGEIQVHGCGIESNWTWGCIALRNPDMVELFSHPELACGVEVLITGSQLELDDLRAIARAPREELRRRGLADPQALGLYQLQHGLPVTCAPDRRTLRSLGL